MLTSSQGMFTSPFYYGGYFAESWMLQYVSNLTVVCGRRGKKGGREGQTNKGIITHLSLSLFFLFLQWAFNEIPIRVLVDLYELHIQTLWFGTNFWNAQAYGSQQMTYITASLEQFMDQAPIDGLYQVFFFFLFHSPILLLTKPNQKPDTKLVLLVSHDTNILYLQRLLDLNWIPRGKKGRRGEGRGGRRKREMEGKR